MHYHIRSYLHIIMWVRDYVHIFSPLHIPVYVIYTHTHTYTHIHTHTHITHTHIRTLMHAHNYVHAHRFWSLLAPHCPLSSYGLPIVSSFGRGCGHQVCIDGKVGAHQRLQGSHAALHVMCVAGLTCSSACGVCSRTHIQPVHVVCVAGLTCSQCMWCVYQGLHPAVHGTCTSAYINNYAWCVYQGSHP